MPEKIIVKRYKLQEEIGAGGMGVVIRAQDTQTDQIVAIKRIKKDAASPALIERFIREGHVLRELDHPNIVELLDAFEHDGQHHIVMRYIAGGNLGQRIAQNALSFDRIIRIGLDLADALTQAHKRNVVHRDLKPANVLIDTDDSVYLTDFGLAQVVGQKGITSTGAIVGTIDYLPPEAFSESPRDAKGDVWSFGVLLAEMLTGVNPFARPTLLETMWAITSEPPPDLESALDACTESEPGNVIALVDLIYRMLERDPAARIASVRHVGAALEDIARGNDAAQDRFNTPTSQILRTFKHNLPLQTTPFVGRDAEADELQKLLSDPQRRLISVIAPGGMGKTRIALEVARRRLSNYPDGAYFIDLAPLSSPDAIAPAIAEAVGFHFHPDGRSVRQQLLDFLHTKSLLLILDNFEYVIDGAALVQDVLQTAPDVQILVTSRQRLNLSAESLFDLAHMAFPEKADRDNIGAYAAVTLFLQSAQHVQPGFELKPDNAEAIIRICRTVEGLPLAIVLAAGWLSMLAPEEIADELARNIDLLDAALVDLPERQRGMRAVFDYSWKLLSANQQTVLVRLSVFRGGFTREAAQTVTGTRLHTLMTLLNKSLLRRDIVSGRFSIHELIRQFAEEKLTASAHNGPTRDAHRDYYLKRLDILVEPLRASGQIRALAEIETGFENIRRAWQRGIETAAYPLLGAAAESLFHFARTRNRHTEVRTLFDQALADAPTTSESADPRLGTARLLLWRTMIDTGTIATPDLDQLARRLASAEARLTDPALAAQTAYEQWFVKYQYLRLDMAGGVNEQIDTAIDHLIEAAEQQNNDWLLALGYHLRGYVDIVLNRHEQSVRTTQSAYERFKALGNLSWAALLANNMAVLRMSARDYDRAEQYLDECIATYRMLGDESRAAHSLCVRGNMNLACGIFDRSERDFREAAPIARSLGYNTGISLAYNGLGFLAWVKGDTDAANRHLRASQAVIPHISTPPDRMMGTVVATTLQILLDGVTDPLQSLSQIAPVVRRLPPNPYGWFFTIAVIHTMTGQGAYERAVRIAGTLHTSGALSAGFQRIIAPILTQVREALGADIYNAAWQQGETDQDFPALLQALLDEFQPA